jgi:NAD(P)-dependent dehydrogenase (short-subunit alcohol dehydrogenase family)
MSDSTNSGSTPTWTEVPTPNRFAGKTVIVTGAGSGIGRATALRVAREGGRVIASDLSQERLDDLISEYPQLDLVAVTGDVSSPADVDRMIAAADGKLHGLVNNAGIMDDFTPVGEVSDETWERVLRINLTGTMLMSRAALPLMLEAGNGSIVNISSEAGLRGSAAGAAYTASKHAVIGLTRNTSVMYGLSGIRCNSVAPGATMTDIKADFRSERAAARLGPLMQANIPAAASAAQLAATITFLLSDDASNINGVVLASDAGWSAI